VNCVLVFRSEVKLYTLCSFAELRDSCDQCVCGQN